MQQNADPLFIGGLINPSEKWNICVYLKVSNRSEKILRDASPGMVYS